MVDQSRIGTDWQPDELDAIVEDYFAMLREELAGRAYVKAHRNAALRTRIGRTAGSIERKHMNISAVLRELGLPYIDGYKPFSNFQDALGRTIESYLLAHPDALHGDALLPVWARDDAQAGPVPVAAEAPAIFEDEAPPPPRAPGAPLTALQAKVADQADDIRAAPAVVFDLRGNNGGSSAWIYALARTLWGEDHVAFRQPQSTAVDWRASEANLATIESYKETFADNAEAMAWLNEISAGLTAARAAGEPLWRQADEDEAPPAEPAAPSPMRARAWVLTDSGCASACLDAVDLLKAMGATHVGLETSGDTVYMEIRQDLLPGGRVTARTPMKVYRGRARGNNETWIPAHVWTGELSDTTGIEAWLAGLDAAAAGR